MRQIRRFGYRITFVLLFLAASARASAAEPAVQQRDCGTANATWSYSSHEGIQPVGIVPPLSAQSFTMTARIRIESPEASGPIFVFGTKDRQMALFLSNGSPVLVLAAPEGVRRIASDKSLPADISTIQLQFSNPSKGSHALLYHQFSVVSEDSILLQDSVMFDLAALPVDQATLAIGSDHLLPAGIGLGPRKLSAQIESLAFEMVSDLHCAKIRKRAQTGE